MASVKSAFRYTELLVFRAGENLFRVAGFELSTEHSAANHMDRN